jgi:hypothetical protein
MKYKNTIKKYLPIVLLIININTCFSMGYVTELKNNAQEFWANANLFTKTAVVGITSYVILSELRNNWNKARIRKLEEKVIENSTQTNETLQIVGAISGDLYDTCPSGILRSFSLDENFIDLTGKHIFRDRKYRNKFVKKTERAKDYYKKTFSTLLKKRNQVQFGSAEITGDTLLKQIYLQTGWLTNITTALGVTPLSGHVPDESLIRGALSMKIAATVNEKYVTKQEYSASIHHISKRIDGIAGGLENTGAILFGEGNSYLLYDSELEKYPERRKQYWEDTFKRTLKYIQEIPVDVERKED